MLADIAAYQFTTNIVANVLPQGASQALMGGAGATGDAQGALKVASSPVDAL